MGGEAFTNMSDPVVPRTKMSLAMALESRRLTEGPLADVASKGFLLGMGSLVDDEIGLARKVAPALVALERPRAQVHPLVHLQILNHAECSRTRVAPV